MRQGEEDFLMALLPGPDGVLDHRLVAGVAVLIPQPLENAVRGVPLLPGRLPVVLQDLPNDRQKRFQLTLGTGLALAVTGGLVVGEDLLEGVPAEAILLYRGALAEFTGQHLPSDFLPELHVGSHSWASLHSRV
jgi:hypothetical protein